MKSNKSRTESNRSRVTEKDVQFVHNCACGIGHVDHVTERWTYKELRDIGAVLRINKTNGSKWWLASTKTTKCESCHPGKFEIV